MTQEDGGVCAGGEGGAASDQGSRNRSFLLVGNECERRVGDRVRIEQYLRANGWKQVEAKFPNEVDLVVFVACGMTEEASKTAILRLHDRVMSGGRVVVYGCFPAMSLPPPGAEVTLIPLRDVETLDSVIEAAVPLREIALPTSIGTEAGAQAALASWDPRVFLPLCGDVYSVLVSQGCPNRCSFCTIRDAVGPLVSQRPEVIAESIRAGLRSGYPVFRMVCENLGTYGRDLGIDLGTLLDVLTAIEEEFQIDLPDLYPSALVDHLESIAGLCARGRVYLMHVPMQSGSQRVLDLMNRRYRTAEVEGGLTALKRRFPSVRIGTDLIVGFPTESVEEFEESVAFARRQHFDWVYVHAFSSRRGTSAAALPDQVPYDEALRRVRDVYTRIPNVLCEVNGYSLGDVGLPRLKREVGI